VELFDSTFSLPGVPSPVEWLGVCRYLPQGNPGINQGGEIEILLDIEYAHATAPGARISAYIGNGDIPEATLRRRCRHRPIQHLNNILEHDHREIKRRV